MRMDIREKLIKLSRKTYKLDSILNICIWIDLVLFVPLIIQFLGVEIFTRYWYNIIFIIFIIFIIIYAAVGILCNSLKMIKDMKGNILYRNNLIYIFLSNEDTVRKILLLLFFLSYILLPVYLKTKINIILSIMYLFMTDKIAKYFENKLQY